MSMKLRKLGLQNEQGIAFKKIYELYCANDCPRFKLDGFSSSPSPGVVSLPIGLPSPVSSIDEPLQAVLSAYSQSSSQLNTVVPSRKRRLSESDTQGVSERPRNRPYDPRPQTASDPLSIPSALFDAYSTTPLDGWFEQSFELPNVFDGGSGDGLTGFDFELGTFPDDPDVQFGLHTGEFFSLAPRH